MKTKGRREAFNLIVLIFVAFLALCSLYELLIKKEDVLTFVIFIWIVLIGEVLYFYFRPEYELTDDALLIHEKKPLPDRQIPYSDMVRYKIVEYKLGEKRKGTAKDVVIVYRKKNRGRTLVISPEDASDFAVVIGRALAKNEKQM